MSLEFLESCLFSLVLDFQQPVFWSSIYKLPYLPYIPANLLGPEIVPPFVLSLQSIVCVALVITAPVSSLAMAFITINITIVLSDMLEKYFDLIGLPFL